MGQSTFGLANRGGKPIPVFLSDPQFGVKVVVFKYGQHECETKYCVFLSGVFFTPRPREQLEMNCTLALPLQALTQTRGSP
jgi:hypothetical protein